MVLNKSYPHSNLVKIIKKDATTRTAKHKMLDADRSLPKLAYFNQKPYAETQKVEKATSSCAAEYATKGKLTLSVLRTPFLDHMLTYDTVLEYIYRHIISPDYLSAMDVEKWNELIKTLPTFTKCCHM